MSFPIRQFLIQQCDINSPGGTYIETFGGGMRREDLYRFAAQIVFKRLAKIPVIINNEDSAFYIRKSYCALPADSG